MDNASRAPRKKPAAPAAETTAEVSLGALSMHLGYALKRAQIAVFDDFHDTVAPLKLSPAQFSVLMLLDVNPGRNQTEIAAALGILRPNFVTLLDAMERRGLVSRTRSADDRRSHVLALTAEGRTILEDAKRLLAARHEAKLDSALTPAERLDLIAMLNRLEKLV